MLNIKTSKTTIPSRRKSIVRQSIVVCAVISALTLLTACQSGASASSNASAGTGSGVPSKSASTQSKSAAGTKTVTVSVMRPNRLLETAKQKFEAAHPNIKIEIKSAIADSGQTESSGKRVMIRNTKPNEQDIEKYMDEINAQIMSGKAADIIDMDNLPYKKYADKHLLENLSALMSQDSSFHQSDYYTNLFDAMKYKGNWVVLPIEASLYMWIGNPSEWGKGNINDSTWTWEDFVKLAKSRMKDLSQAGKPEVYPLGYIDPSQLITFMLDTSFDKFVDTGAKQAKFDSPAFIHLLKLAKSMYDDHLMPSQKGDPGVTMFQSKANIMNPMFMHFMQQTAYGGKGKFYDIPSENDKRGTLFATDMPLAINAKTPNKQAAWAFLKFLLSDPMQSEFGMAGFPVNKQAEKARENNLLHLGQGSAGGRKTRIMMNGKTVTPKPATPQEIAGIDQAIEGAKVYADSNPKIMDIVRTETTPFFQGQKSAEATARIIQDKVSTYLQE